METLNGLVQSSCTRNASSDYFYSTDNSDKEQRRYYFRTPGAVEVSNHEQQELVTDRDSHADYDLPHLPSRFSLMPHAQIALPATRTTLTHNAALVASP